MMKYVFKKTRYRILAPLFDLAGSIVFFPIKVFKKNPPLDPKSILVIRLDHIGDFICTSPVFENLKSRFPSARITALVNSASKELAFRNPHIDKVIAFSPFWLDRRDKSSSLRALLRVIKDVRNIGFDLGIEPRGDILSIIIMWLGRVKYRVGYGITGGGFLLHKEGKYDKKAHIIDRNLTLLEALNIPVAHKLPDVYFNEKDKDAVEGLLLSPKSGGIAMTEKEGGARNDGSATGLDRAVVIHPFAGSKAKEWPRENFCKLIELLKENGYSVLLVGSKGDNGVFENTIDLRGRLNLPQLACLIKKIGFFIGLDSGPANIAAALNVPSIIICSGTNIPQLWIPKSPNVKFLYKDIECRPCENKVCPKAKHECMEAISVDDVLGLVEDIYHQHEYAVNKNK